MREDFSTPFTADELRDRVLTPRLFNVPDMIPAGTVTTIDGDGGTGKSTLALQLAVATVLGAQWLGLDVMKGRALYLSAEDDVPELHRRLSDLTLHYGVDLDALSDLTIWPLSDALHSVLADTGEDGALRMTELWHEFAEMVGDLLPKLVVLDSRADIYAASENDRAAVRQFVSSLRRLAGRWGAGLVLLAHPSLAGMSSGSGSSGSTAWNNSVRSRLYLTRPSQEGADPDLRLLKVAKANYAAGGGEIRIRRLAGFYVAEE